MSSRHLVWPPWLKVGGVLDEIIRMRSGIRRRDYTLNDACGSDAVLSQSRNVGREGKHQPASVIERMRPKSWYATQSPGCFQHTRSHHVPQGTTSAALPGRAKCLRGQARETASQAEGWCLICLACIPRNSATPDEARTLYDRIASN